MAAGTGLLGACVDVNGICFKVKDKRVTENNREWMIVQTPTAKGQAPSKGQAPIIEGTGTSEDRPESSKGQAPSRGQAASRGVSRDRHLRGQTRSSKGQAPIIEGTGTFEFAAAL